MNDIIQELKCLSDYMYGADLALNLLMENKTGSPISIFRVVMNRIDNIIEKLESLDEMDR